MSPLHKKQSHGPGCSSERRKSAETEVEAHAFEGITFIKGMWNSKSRWVFLKIGVPQNGWFMMENPIKMDDLGVPLFLETPRC